MIASISGRVLETRVDGLVINIGGVGMFVLCAPDIIANSKIGEEVSVQTALIVREDSLTLFGFATAESRELFRISAKCFRLRSKISVHDIGFTISAGF